MDLPRYQLSLNVDDTWQMDRPHFHEDIEILLSLSAGGNFLIGNELYSIEERSLFLFNEATLHKSVSNFAYTRYVLHLSPRVLQEFSTQQSDLISFLRKRKVRNKILNKEQTAELLQKFQRLEKGHAPDFCSDIQELVLLLDLLTSVFVLFETPDEGVPVRKINQDFTSITPILNYIQENISEPLTLDDLADRFFINKYHMCHIFKEATGFSVMEYIINCRILKARELLRQGLRVQDVGERVGFQNNAHFIRTFSNLTGISPKRYANEYLAGDKVEDRKKGMEDSADF